MYPDYRGAGIVNLMASVINACGGRADAYAPLPTLELQPLAGARKLVLLVLDGLGYDYLSRRAADSVLQRHLRGRLTSVAPPTTATAITIAIAIAVLVAVLVAVITAAAVATVLVAVSVAAAVCSLACSAIHLLMTCPLNVALCDLLNLNITHVP